MLDPDLQSFPAWLLRQIRRFGPYTADDLTAEAEIHQEGWKVKAALAELAALQLIECEGDEWKMVHREDEPEPEPEPAIKQKVLW
jgi:hypothetical protein